MDTNSNLLLTIIFRDLISKTGTISISTGITGHDSSNRDCPGQTETVGMFVKLKKIPFLCQPICTGLCHDKYNTNLFDPAESESAHDRLPLVRDPALVRAAQLDILKLQNHPTENIQSRVQQIVHAFGSIEKDFKASLRADSCRNAIREYKTSTKNKL